MGSGDSTSYVWQDNFEGASGTSPSASNWNFERGAGGWGNNELQTYTDSTKNAALDGHGKLLISASGSSAAGYTSARITTEGKMTFTYGVLQARIKLPEGKGLLPAFWLLGTDLPTVGYPACGEIDVVETPSTTKTSYATIHGPTSAGAGYQVGSRANHPLSLSEGYHVYSLIHRKDLIEMKIDGVTVQKVTPASLADGQSWVYNKPFYVLLDVAVGGDFPGAPDASTRFPAVMSVDWMRLSK